jgi:hypothetical protein
MTGRQLSEAADNCGGQNKNNMVTWQTISFRRIISRTMRYFSVRGHKKNAFSACITFWSFDSNTKAFTFNYDATKNDMLAVLGQCEDISVVVVKDDIFRDWDLEWSD